MRVVQIVTNHEDLQLYAAETCFRALRSEPGYIYIYIYIYILSLRVYVC